MIQFILAGLVLGSIYALSAVGIIVTYVSAGILNFAAAATGFFVARFYYFLHIQHGWPILTAAVVSIFLVGPAFGLFAWAVLFRFLRLSSPTIKVVSTIGLSVAIPPVAVLLFGNQSIQAAPGLAPQPVRVFHVLGTVVTLDQLIVYGCLLIVVVAGGALLRFTTLGIRVRGLVDSEAMASLSGINPQRVSAGVWAVSTFLSGLAGVLVAPIIGLNTTAFTFLLASAFAAVIAAQLKNLGVAVVIGLLMGVATSLAQGYLPPASSVTADVVPSIPFVFLVVSLVYFTIRSGRSGAESAAVGGALDRAIAVTDHRRASLVDSRGSPAPTRVASFLALVLVAVLPLLLHGFWVGLVGQGLAFGIFFLSYTLVTGEGGMIWLCQITFAGIGAITTAQLATVHGWPVLAAFMGGGLISAVTGMVIGVLTIRLGDLYVALATLTFGVLVENIVFTSQSFYNYGQGVPVSPPFFAEGTRSFSWFALLVFVVLAAVTLNYRRATAGMAMNAARWSRPAAQTLGIRIVPTKVFVATLAAFMAGVGGGLLACYANAAIPSSYDVFTGLIWFAVLVTVGIRSVAAAAIAGLTFSFVPALVVTYLPASWGDVPPALFGLGAIMAARNPDGTLATQARQLEALIARLGSRRRALTAAAAATRPVSRTKSGSVRLSPSPRPASPGPQPSRPTAQAPDALLHGEGITVRFGGVCALFEVDVSVPPRSIVGLIGPNGSGKSTLFAVLSGLLRPAAGRVFLFGSDVTAKSPQARARMGLARTFQHPELFRDLSVREHLVLAYRMQFDRRRLWLDLFDGRAWRSAAAGEEERVDALLEMLGIADIARAPVTGLPLGTSRLIEVARALAGSPSLVLLDEPTSGLDAAESERLGTVLTRVTRREGVSFMLVEHDVDMVLSLCESVSVINLGKVIASGDPDAIRQDAGVRAAYLGDDPSAIGKVTG